jgi:hypothetical protein
MPIVGSFAGASARAYGLGAGLKLIDVEYLVIAGGGSGGSGGGAGGGAGGYRTATLKIPLGAHTVTIGAGGAAVTSTANVQGNIGNNSVFSTITSTGGGSGGAYVGGTGTNGGNGGSGGGGGLFNGTGGTAT